MLRPVFMEFAAAIGGLLDHEGWFMVGPQLLVAPALILESPHPQTLIPPPGDWYDYWSGERAQPETVTAPFQGGTREVRCLTYPARLERLPVLVRAGAILPKQPLVQSTGETPDGPLALHVYPDADGRAAGELYWDDGESFGYRQGDYLRQRFTWDGALRTTSEGDHRPWWSEVSVTVHG
jgi:alpha-glucosidase